MKKGKAYRPYSQQLKGHWMSLPFLKNKAISVFWHCFNPFYEFMVPFLSIPCCSPRNICIIWFSQLKECLCSLKFLYPLLQFSPAFSPISKFINNIKLSSPPSSHASRSPFSFPFCAAQCPSLFFLFLSHQSFHKANPTIYVPDDVPCMFYGISHIHGAESQLQMWDPGCCAPKP